MKISGKELLFDIANMAYTIADTGELNRHTLHRVRDICEEGNIQRVERVLHLAYSNVIGVLHPVMRAPKGMTDEDCGRTPGDFEFRFIDNCRLRSNLTAEARLRIKEMIREYMVCMVLHDWLTITLPEAADVWKDKYETAYRALGETASVNIKKRRVSFL